MSDATLRLAFAGIHPDRLAALMTEAGGAGRVLSRLEGGAIEVPDAARAAVGPSAAARRELLVRAGIEFVELSAPGYPRHLAELPTAPPGLFLRGQLPAEPGIAVVGTRRCTRYGRRLARAYGQVVAAAGWVLVSGLARGIDGAAHRGTVDAGGRGVAVLGSGLDVMYPREHAGLAADLLALDGAVVSEYPPDARPYGWRFPPRNRIISGLSRAVVVVEAGTTGGALITARLALDQGVSVFAVPGDVGRESSRGCNLLIRDGAHPVLEPEDLVEEMALLLGPPQPAESRSASAEGRDRPLLDEVHKEGTATVDAIAGRLGMAVGEVLAAVVRLEGAGLVEFDGGTIRPNGH